MQAASTKLRLDASEFQSPFVRRSRFKVAKGKRNPSLLPSVVRVGDAITVDARDQGSPGRRIGLLGLKLGKAMFQFDTQCKHPLRLGDEYGRCHGEGWASAQHSPQRAPPRWPSRWPTQLGSCPRGTCVPPRAGPFKVIGFATGTKCKAGLCTNRPKACSLNRAVASDREAHDSGRVDTSDTPGTHTLPLPHPPLPSPPSCRHTHTHTPPPPPPPPPPPSCFLGVAHVGVSGDCVHAARRTAQAPRRHDESTSPHADFTDPYAVVRPSDPTTPRSQLHVHPRLGYKLVQRLQRPAVRVCARGKSLVQRRRRLQAHPQCERCCPRVRCPQAARRTPKPPHGGAPSAWQHRSARCPFAGALRGVDITLDVKRAGRVFGRRR